MYQAGVLYEIQHTIVKGKLQELWEESHSALFKVLLQYLPGQSEEPIKYQCQNSFHGLFYNYVSIYTIGH
jgi:hypothetical protein